MKYEKTPNIKEDIKEKRQNYYTSRVQYKNVVCDMKGECMAKERDYVSFVVGVRLEVNGSGGKSRVRGVADVLVARRDTIVTASASQHFLDGCQFVV